LDLPILRHLGVAFGHSPLDVDGAAYRVNHAGELDQDAVARWS
jgi:hypothetical protein